MLTFAIGQLFEEYGWYILGIVVLTLFIYGKLQPYIIDFKKRRAEQDYEAKYHKNPDAFVARLISQQAKVEKLQEKYNESVAQFKLRQQEKEAQRRDEILNQGNKNGYVLGGAEDTLKQTFKPEYNPLMGAGSSSNYRPPKRSCCGKK